MKQDDSILLNLYFPETAKCPKCGGNLYRDKKSYEELESFFDSKKDPKIEFSLVLYNISVPYVCDTCKYDTKMNRHGLSM